MVLRGFDSDRFLQNHWQRQPLLLRNPWQSWRNPLEPDELAGLACEEGVESRLIIHKANGWNVEHGPLPLARFSEIGKEPWTLLVQAVDHHVPAVAAILEAFRFIPDWRIDDVMVSYAADGGGVGPHFDQYDVFLVQGLGKRRWQVGDVCDQTTELVPHEDLRLIANFKATDEWILEPGDILYLPPGVAHNGVAVGDDCMTYSIGFRAPSRRELIENWCEHVAEELAEDDRFGDPGLRSQENPGEIAAEALEKLHALVIDVLADRNRFGRWFGQYSTCPKSAELEWQRDEAITPDELRLGLAEGTPLIRNPASRFSFIRQSPTLLLLFVDGRSFDCTDETIRVAEALCAASSLVLDPNLAGCEPATELIGRLINQGSIAFDSDDDYDAA